MEILGEIKPNSAPRPYNVSALHDLVHDKLC